MSPVFMLKLLALTVMSTFVLPVPVAIAQKVLVAVDGRDNQSPGNHESVAHYVERDSISRDGSQVFWRNESVSMTADGELYDHQTFVSSVDCANPSEYKVRTLTTYVSDGRSVYRTQSPGDAGPSLKVVPGSIAEDVVEFVCSQ